jgi:hypothetical protein
MTTPKILAICTAFLIIGVSASVASVIGTNSVNTEPQSVEIALLALQASDSEYGYAVPASGASTGGCTTTCTGGGRAEVCTTTCTVNGCTDVNANNYEATANSNDGSCTYDSSVTPGCTDSAANNYNAAANSNDGSCTYNPPLVYGCTNSIAINYNLSANTDDGSCTYYPTLPTVSITADSELVRSGSDFTVEWDPNGWLGGCTLLPSGRFVGEDPDTAGNVTTAVTAKTVFTYRCAAPAGVYAATPSIVEVEAEVEVFPDAQEI